MCLELGKELVVELDKMLAMMLAVAEVPCITSTGGRCATTCSCRCFKVTSGS